MSQTPCVTTVFEPEMWDNRNASGGAGNTTRRLTHSLDTSEEKAPMKTTRPCSIDGCTRDAA